MKETRVEVALGGAVKARGGWSVKLLPSVAGLPDRIVLLPGGRIFFVELKAPKKTAAPHQLVVHSRLRRLGFTVVVLDTVPKVEEWVAAIS